MQTYILSLPEKIPVEFAQLIPRLWDMRWLLSIRPHYH